MSRWPPKADMWGKVLLSILILAGSAQASAEISRKGARAQREFATTFAPLRLCARNDFAQTNDVSIEVFQILELPLTVHEASLVKTDKGYVLKLSLGNSSDLKMIGLRYSLAKIDSKNQLELVVNRTEASSVKPYATKSFTFTIPIKFKPKDGERLVLMLEQVISRESIWEVVKAKEAFEAYAGGDYSVMPTVLRVANQVDAPPIMPRVFFE